MDRIRNPFCKLVEAEEPNSTPRPEAAPAPAAAAAPVTVKPVEIKPVEPVAMTGGKTQAQPAVARPIAAQARPVARATARLPEQTVAMRPPKRHVNWALIIGAIIVGLVLFFSVLGPQLATGDPLEENVIIKAGDTWVKPPFLPFEVPGFPLGSDQFGRNLFSRILYAIQPTMVMVMVVALVRLVLGTVIGLGADFGKLWAPLARK